MQSNNWNPLGIQAGTAKMIALVTPVHSKLPPNHHAFWEVSGGSGLGLRVAPVGLGFRFLGC